MRGNVTPDFAEQELERIGQGEYIDNMRIEELGIRYIAVLRTLSLWQKEREEQCDWTPADDEYGDRWETSCGEAYCFEYETPKGHGYNYCPSCGKMLVEKERKIEDDCDW